MDPSHALCKSINPLINALPPEIRNRIYEYVLAHDERVDVKAHQPGLLRTCRQIREESESLFYHSARFIIKTKSRDGGALAVMGRWMKAIGSENANSIGSLAIVLDRSYGMSILRMLNEHDTTTKLAMNLLNCAVSHSPLMVEIPGATTLSDILVPREVAACMRHRDWATKLMSEDVRVAKESYDMDPFSGSRKELLRPWALLALCRTFVSTSPADQLVETATAIMEYSKMRKEATELMAEYCRLRSAYTAGW